MTMKKIGFDSQKYIELQSARIRERIDQFGGKLYLEFGGKLFDDFHASRVLPGFEPDNKIKMLLELKDQAEIVIAINANDIEKNKRRGDLGITYDEDALRLIDAFRAIGSTWAASPSRTTAASPPPTTSASGSRPWTCASTSSTGYPITPPTSPSSSPTRASGKTTT